MLKVQCKYGCGEELLRHNIHPKGAACRRCLNKIYFLKREPRTQKITHKIVRNIMDMTRRGFPNIANFCGIKSSELEVIQRLIWGDKTLEKIIELEKSLRP